MSDIPSRSDRAYRIVFDGAVVVAVAMNLSAGLYWAGVIHQQVMDVRGRVESLEEQNTQRNVAITDIAVRLGRIEQKLSDIGQRVGAP